MIYDAIESTVSSKHSDSISTWTVHISKYKENVQEITFQNGHANSLVLNSDDIHSDKYG